MVLRWFPSAYRRDPLSSLVRERLGSGDAGLGGLKPALPASVRSGLRCPARCWPAPPGGGKRGEDDSQPRPLDCQQ